MDIIAPEIMKEVLSEDLEKFNKYVMEINPVEFETYNEEKLFSLYIFSLLDNTKALKIVRNKCINSGRITGKKFNEFIYLSMKYVDKLNLGIWSFHEATELNIDIDNIKKLTLTYTIL